MRFSWSLFFMITHPMRCASDTFGTVMNHKNRLYTFLNCFISSTRLFWEKQIIGFESHANVRQETIKLRIEEWHCEHLSCGCKSICYIIFSLQHFYQVEKRRLVDLVEHQVPDKRELGWPLACVWVLLIDSYDSLWIE